MSEQMSGLRVLVTVSLVFLFAANASVWAVEKASAKESKVTYTLTINVVGNGTTSPEAGTHVYEETPVFLSAYAETGWAFDHWEGDLTGTEPLNQFLNMNADKMVTAVFVEGGVPLTVSVAGNGTTSPAAGTYTYVAGRTVNIYAYPSYGWLFSHWEGDLSGTAPSGSVIMDSAKTVTAVFTDTAPTVTLTILVTGNGSVNPSAGAHTYSLGEGVTLSATPDAGWAFDQWQGDFTGTHPWNQLIVMDSNKTITAVFVEGGIPLTISLTGNGSTSPPAGTYNYVADRTVPVSAQPGIGWAFSHWEGDLSGSGNPTQITMDQAKSITAVFLASRTLAIQTQGIGTVDVSEGTHTYLDGEQVSLTATPENGWRFDHWEGDLSGSDNPASITMDSDKTVTAVFVARMAYTLYTSVSGQGTISPEPISHDYYEGEVVEISATPSVNWQFDHWEGDLSGSENPTTITMDADKTVSAVFTSVGYSLTTSLTGSGFVDPAGTTSYSSGTTVTLTAYPEDHWSFQEWQGDLTGPDNPAQLLMDGDKNVNAVFVLDSHTLTTNALGNGTVDPTGTTTHPYGAEATLTATPEAGWTFQEWQGDLTGTVNPARLLIDGDKTVTAVFVPLYSLTTSVVGNGSVTPAGTSTHPEGTEVTLTTTPERGWVFQEWQGDLTGTSTPAQLLMNSDKNVTAVFVEESEGGVEGTPEGISEGEGGVEGTPEGVAEGEGSPQEGSAEGETGTHFADQNGDGLISLSELLRVIQFFNSEGFHCEAGTEDGFAPGPGDTACTAHSSDYNPHDWHIGLSELLRLIQFFNSGGYHYCPDDATEDGYCPGVK